MHAQLDLEPTALLLYLPRGFCSSTGLRIIALASSLQRLSVRVRYRSGITVHGSSRLLCSGHIPEPALYTWHRHLVSTGLASAFIGSQARCSFMPLLLAHSYLDAFPLLVHPQAGHIRATVMQAGVQELLLFIADPIPCRVEDEEQDHGDSEIRIHKPWNLDTAITAMSALMIVMLVPSGRY